MSEGVCAPLGFVAGGYTCGIKPSGEPDLALLLATEGSATVAGVFTRNRFAAPSVRYNRAVVGRGKARAIITNSGIANAATGQPGFDNTLELARLTGDRFQIPAEEVLVCSTGIIGVQLPMDELGAGVAKIPVGPGGGPAAAKAIMTTDAGPKFGQRTIPTAAGRVTIGAMCKGAGMIHPNMATMLAYITTDAAISRPALQQLTTEVADETFNAVSIDGDTSTNDSLLVLGSGASGIALEPDCPDWAAFATAFRDLAWEMAEAIVAGGEGVNQVFVVEVNGASSQVQARQIARAVTTSMLVKTAVRGADPNFGRILCAAGYSGAEFDSDRMDLYLGAVQTMRQGLPIAFDAQRASTELARPRSTMTLELHSGPYRARGVGCDLSAEYVAFNSEYTT